MAGPPSAPLAAPMVGQPPAIHPAGQSACRQAAAEPDQPRRAGWLAHDDVRAWLDLGNEILVHQRTGDIQGLINAALSGRTSEGSNGAPPGTAGLAQAAAAAPAEAAGAVAGARPAGLPGNTPLLDPTIRGPTRRDNRN